MRKPIALLLAAALGGCDLTATAEADRVCVTEPTTATVPAAPAVPAGTSVSVSVPTAITLDVGAAIPDDLGKNGVTAEAVAQSLTLSSTQANVDFSGVESAEVTVSATGQPSVVFRYTKPAGATNVTALVATPTTRVDLVQYLEGQQRIRVSNIAVTGRPPTQAWTPVFKTCASAKVDADYLEAL